jgi:hypothetical protein
VFGLFHGLPDASRLISQQGYHNQEADPHAKKDPPAEALTFAGANPEHSRKGTLLFFSPPPDKATPRATGGRKAMGLGRAETARPPKENNHFILEENNQ